MAARSKVRSVATPRVLAAPLTTFLARYPRKTTVIVTSSIESFEGDEHELVIDPKGATDRLDGEDVFDPDRHAAIGEVADIPVLVDVTKKLLPVFVLADGEYLRIAASLAAFAKKIHPLKPRSAVKGSLLEPKTVKDTLANHWPRAQTTVWQLSGGGGFLWVEPERLRAPLRDVYYERIRKGLPAATRWKAVELAYDRGTGVFLDVARFDRVPLVTPRVRAMLEKFPLDGVEFLQVRVKIKNKHGDYFVVNPTQHVDCLDAAACDFVNDEPRKLVMRTTISPSNTVLFRAKGFPRPIFAAAELVDALHDAQLSGIGFTALDRWTP